MLRAFLRFLWLLCILSAICSFANSLIKGVGLEIKDPISYYVGLIGLAGYFTAVLFVIFVIK